MGGEHLINKVISKIQNNQDFKLVVVTPLMPGSEGDLRDKSGGLVRVIMGYQYYTLLQGKNSIYEKIAEHTPNPDKYFKVIGLRNHAIAQNGEPVESMVYIHSK